jgi:amino acid adenylation domain-containing protein
MFDETQVETSSARAESGSGSSYKSAELKTAKNNGSRSKCTPEMVAAQAVANPGAPAVVAGSTVLTYRELDRCSNQIARYLQSLGVGPDQLVGLSMERSPAMVTAALGILKAGGAYVPLDSSLPVERLDFMLHDSEVQVLIADGSSAKKLPKGNWRVIDVQKQANELDRFSFDAFPYCVSEHNLAYVIYTSGSTGQPKGVEITHGGLANLISWHCRAFQVTARDRASHQAAVGFDAAVWEIWPYLAAGASVHISPESCRTNPEALRDWIIEQKISITFLATPLAERMLSFDWPSHTSLRALLTGADTLHRRPSANLPFALVNNYGPTECTVVATSGTVAPDNASTSHRLPSVGKPIDNTQIYIVDEQMREVPAGEPGELGVAGAGLARGYRKRDELTREKFVPNPFSSQPNGRLYKTGDLARLLPNGEIEFLGRIDEQIKIRGFRIEPNEIVSVLDQHPGVSASAVVAYENQANRAGEKSLVAYVVPVAANAMTATTLREHLSKRLPDYMLPSSFVRVEALPLTGNGKVDRAALPAPSNANLLAEENFVAPSGPVQERLASVIASLLHVERIGANDNFFMLGGHSLLGTQLIARVSETFGVELPLLQLFDHPTLAEMSDAIEQLILAKLEEANAIEPHPNHAA